MKETATNQIEEKDEVFRLVLRKSDRETSNRRKLQQIRSRKLKKTKDNKRIERDRGKLINLVRKEMKPRFENRERYFVVGE